MDLEDVTEKINELSGIAEAVIVSGPRKGEFILVDGDQIMSAAPVEALLEQLMAAADALGKTVDAQTAEINHLQNEANKLRRDLNDTSERLIRSEALYDAQKAERSSDRADSFLPSSAAGSGSGTKKGN